jgi:hypothetical protein
MCLSIRYASRIYRQIMFVLIPLICFGFIYFSFYVKSYEDDDRSCWRNSFLSASIIFGFLITTITEILSIFHLITFGWILGFWILFTLISGFICFILITHIPSPFREKARLRVISNLIANRVKYYQQITPFELLLLIGIIIIVFVIGLIALIAPPNNWDSMTYHLSRVVHWIQNQSVANYPTHILRQLFQNPYAEFAIMHLQILSNGDRFANLIQWFGMIGSILGITLIAKQLGANTKGQIFTAIVSVTIPMGILQGSSTQNDYVVSFWLVCFVYYIMMLKMSKTEKSIWVYSLGTGISLGLAILSKPTAYIFAIPFIIYYFLSQLKSLIKPWSLDYGLENNLHGKFLNPPNPLFQRGNGSISPFSKGGKGDLRLIQNSFPHSNPKNLKSFAIIAVVSLIINIGHYARNYDLFGSPFGPMQDSGEKYTNEAFSIPFVISNVVRNVSLHINPPPNLTYNVNSIIERGINQLHGFMGIDINDPDTTYSGARFRIRSLSNHEDSAGNPLHLLLIVLSMIIFFISKQQRKSLNLLFYFIATTSAFLLFCICIKWQPWNSRLHLPLFILYSPFIAIVFSRISVHKITNSIAVILILSAFPWVLYNESRPIIGDSSHFIAEKNIFNTNRSEQYFNNRPYLMDPYIRATDFLDSKRYSCVGLIIRNNDWEYPFWYLLNRHNTQIVNIEHVNVTNISVEKSGIYAYNSIKPCAIISLCDEKSTEIVTKDGTYEKKWSSDTNYYPIVDVFIRK